MISKYAIGLIAMTAALMALPAMTQEALPHFPDMQVTDCQPHDVTQETADRTLAMQTLDIMRTHDMARLNAQMPTLQAALAHAPDRPSHPELCGTTLMVYTDHGEDMLTMSALVADPKNSMGAVKVEQRETLPYPLLAFIIGWIEYENKDYQAAHATYTKGLLNDPNYHEVVMEDTLTLAALGQSQAALTQLDAYLARNADLPDELMAGAERKRGYVLVELGRWDEAEASYQASLKLAPDDETAKGELEYIAQNRPSKTPN